eukprot:3584093-Rhodomonas_salina.3
MREEGGGSHPLRGLLLDPERPLPSTAQRSARPCEINCKYPHRRYKTVPKRVLSALDSGLGFQRGFTPTKPRLSHTCPVLARADAPLRTQCAASVPPYATRSYHHTRRARTTNIRHESVPPYAGVRTNIQHETVPACAARQYYPTPPQYRAGRSGCVGA